MKIKKRIPKIVIDPKIHFGKPIIAETRIPVYAVLELVEAGIPFEKIITNYYPDLKSKTTENFVRSLRYINQ